jgi:hypothetical protein
MKKEISFTESHAATNYWGMEYFFAATQLTPDVFRGKRILNVGAGQIDMKEALAQRGINNCEVVSFDLAYDTTRKPWWRKHPKIIREMIPENAVSGDFKRLPFVDNSFDIAIASWSIIPYIGWYEQRSKRSIEAIKDMMRISNNSYLLPCNEWNFNNVYRNAFPGYKAEHLQPIASSLRMPGALYVSRIG